MRHLLLPLLLLLCISMIIGITGASINGIGGVKTPAFSPGDIAGLQLWLKADEGTLDNSDAAITTDNTAVKTWSDQSGNSNDAVQASAANQMVWRDGSNGINGLPAVENIAGGNLFLTGSTQLFSNSVSVFAVVQQDATTGSQVFFNLGTTYPNGFVVYTSQFYSTPRYGLQAAGGFSNNDVTVSTDPILLSVIANTSPGNPVIANTNYRVNSSTISLQYAFYGSLNYPTYSASTFQIGNNGLNGRIGEIIVYNTQLSSGDRDDVEAYLTDKWGL